MDMKEGGREWEMGRVATGRGILGGGNGEGEEGKGEGETGRGAAGRGRQGWGGGNGEVGERGG